MVGDPDAARTGVLTNDNEDSMTALVTGPPPHGALALARRTVRLPSPGGQLQRPGFVRVQVHDGTKSAPVTVTITVNPVNDAPVANPQTVTTSEDTAKAFVLTGADTEGSPLTFSVVTPPTNGVLSGTAPNLTYTPNLNFNGSDAFTFKVNDGAADSAVAATVGINVTAVNDAPVAGNDTYTMTQGTALTVLAPGVLGNDTDAEGAALTAVLVTGPANCTFTLNANGSFTFTPAANFTGNATFTYKAKDGVLFSNVATVTITVTAAPYGGIINVKNLPPAAGVTFKPSSKGTLVDFEVEVRQRRQRRGQQRRSSAGDDHVPEWHHADVHARELRPGGDQVRVQIGQQDVGLPLGAEEHPGGHLLRDRLQRQDRPALPGRSVGGIRGRVQELRHAGERLGLSRSPGSDDVHPRGGVCRGDDGRRGLCPSLGFW